jgi:release factor glutamine methyltransferase
VKDTMLDMEASQRFEAAIERLAQGEPLAHVTGSAGFRHLTVQSDRRALIPRPETEGLVDLVLARVREGRVADIGTGTGCIALSLAQEGKFSSVVGVDRSEAALALAAANRNALGLAVDLVEGDLCSALKPGVWNAVVSNPPYLTAAEYAALDGSVRDWEPAEALASGLDGLDATRRIAAQALTAVVPGGWLVLEVDCTRAGEVAQLVADCGWQEIDVHHDLFDRARYLTARRSEAA